jgi:alkanesulfonate monooxygenase SsuD/methylene tetrahydromethanopterin reductase-like flavin-dependent oxidoreductase (luciferase family)
VARRRGGLTVRHGLYVAPFGELADVRALAEVAATAEDSGWDGFFVWDHVMTFDGLAVADPWIALTAVALATERLRLGAMVTPLARRRPWDVARQVAVLDRLTNGRMIFGAGLGGDSRRELTAFGEDALVRPTPLQQPRPPVWLGCVWPHRRPLVRAARYDGVFPVSHRASLTGGDVRALLEIVAERRVPEAGAFDVVLVNHERPDAARLVDLGAAGATWWLQGFGERPSLADVQDAAAAGPPQ